MLQAPLHIFHRLYTYPSPPSSSSTSSLATTASICTLTLGIVALTTYNSSLRLQLRNFVGEKKRLIEYNIKRVLTNINLYARWRSPPFLYGRPAPLSIEPLQFFDFDDFDNFNYLCLLAIEIAIDQRTKFPHIFLSRLSTFQILPYSLILSFVCTYLMCLSRGIGITIGVWKHCLFWQLFDISRSALPIMLLCKALRLGYY